MPTNFPTPEQLHAFEHFISEIVSALPRISLVTVLVAALIATLWRLLPLLIGALTNRHRKLPQLSFLELTPLAFSDRSPLAMEQLLSVLHALQETRPWNDKLLRRMISLSLEIVSTREAGIRFFVGVAHEQLGAFERKLASFHDLRVREAEDYLPADLGATSCRVLSLKQTGKHFGYPLASYDSLSEADPLAQLTAAMTRLASGELMAVQLVLTPAKIKHAATLGARLLQSEEALETLGRRRLSLGRSLAYGLGSVSFALTEAVGDIVHGPSTVALSGRSGVMNHKQQVVAGIKPARTMSGLEQEHIKPVYDKLAQPLFYASICALVVGGTKARQTEHLNDVRGSLAAFSTNYQSLQTTSSFLHRMQAKRLRRAFKERQPVTHNGSSILSVAEVAGLYHFPQAQSAEVENVARSLSHTLPTSATMKHRVDRGELDIVLGRSNHQGSDIPIGLTAREREKHLYVIGATGSGKTTLLEHAIVQDIRAGKGLAVIDPHGDMAKKLLGYIPEERVHDVIYLNPVDIEYPITINPLQLPEGLSPTELLLEQGRVTSAVVSIFRKVFSDDQANAHRIEAVMRNALRTVLTTENPTIFTIQKLLRNTAFRKAVVAKLDDEDLKDYWREEFGSAGNMQRVSMTKGLTMRLDHFLSEPTVKRMFERPKSTINFEEIMDSGKILICNLAHGDIGEDASSLIGTTILAKLKLAAERRSRLREQDRRPFYVYVDEFQNFATTPFVKMLSSARKYKLFLTIAQQSTKQQEDDRLTEDLLSNIGTVVCFRTGSPADEELLLKKFEPFVKYGEIGNLPAHTFYVRMQAEESMEPMSGETVLLPTTADSDDSGSAIIQVSRENYARAYEPPAVVMPTDKPKIDANQDKAQRKPQGRKKKQTDGDDYDPIAQNDDN